MDRVDTSWHRVGNWQSEEEEELHTKIKCKNKKKSEALMQMSSDLQVRKRVVHLEQEVVSRRVILSLSLSASHQNANQLRGAAAAAEHTFIIFFCFTSP